MPNEIEAPAERATTSDRTSPPASNPEFATLFDRSSSTSRTSTPDKNATSLDMSTGSLYGSSFDPLSPTAAKIDSPADKGEPLTRGLSPESAKATRDSHLVTPGETLDSIATSRLGDSASAGDRELFSNAIRTINQLGPEGQPKPGDSLKLPVREANGNFVFQGDNHSMKFFRSGKVDTTVGDTTTQKYPDGRTVTTSPTGTIDVDPKAGTTTLTKGDDTTILKKDGSVTTLKKSDGPGVGTTTYPDKSVERFTPESRTRVSEDGRILSLEQTYLGKSGTFKRTPDANGGVVDKHTGDRSQHNFTLTESRDGAIRLSEGAGDRQLTFSNDVSLTDSRRELLDKATGSITEPGALSRFKADMVRFENRATENGLGSTEIQDTYKAIGRLLTGGSSEGLPQPERTALASQVMSQVATPGIIEQGTNNTCSVASLENVITSTHPSRAAGLIADVATTGQFRSSDGTVTQLPQENLRPLPESTGHTLADKSRSYASQLFQLTAINAVLDSKQTGTQFVQDREPKLGSSGIATSGERLISKSSGSPVLDDKGQPLTNPDFRAPEIIKAHELITGEKRPDVVLGHGAEPSLGDSVRDMNRFSTMEEFGERLDAMKKAGKLPAILAVHSLNQPFLKDSNGMGGTGGWHAVVVSDYKDGMVSIDNQWGDKSDRQLSLKDTYAATRKPR